MLSTWRISLGKHVQAERERLGIPALVGWGDAAGRSMLKWHGVGQHSVALFWHFLTQDLFTSLVNMPLGALLAVTTLVYFVSVLVFAVLWYLMWRGDGTCFTEFDDGWHSAFAFSVETQITIGYGYRSPTHCDATFYLVFVQSMVSVFINAALIGVLFTKISHPSYRGQTLLVSDSLCIARRDGVLVLLFRLADLRSIPIIDCSVRACLYLWGPGRTTREGETVKVQRYDMAMPDVNGQLVLPHIVEHVIDESSPLYGHTHGSLNSLNAEIVVSVQGTNDLGSIFVKRRSYLPREIHWGCVFQEILSQEETPRTLLSRRRRPAADEVEAAHVGQRGRYCADLRGFHEVLRQPGVPSDDPEAASRYVVFDQPSGREPLPFPGPGSNTLVLSSKICVYADAEGAVRAAVRAGDTHTAHILETHARVYLHRWDAVAGGGGAAPRGAPGAVAGQASLGAGDDLEGFEELAEQVELGVGYDEGRDRMWMRFPVEIAHRVDDASPLRGWRTAAGVAADAGCEVVVVVEGQSLATGSVVHRRRVYRVPEDVEWGARFQPMVYRQRRGAGPPGESAADAPPVSALRPGPHAHTRILWHRFHRTRPCPVLRGGVDERLELEGGAARGAGGPATPAGTVHPPGGGGGALAALQGGASFRRVPRKHPKDVELMAYWPVLDAEGSRHLGHAGLE